MINWEKYFNANLQERWKLLEKDNRLSYDHVDNWLMSLKDYLKTENNKRVEKMINDLNNSIDKNEILKAIQIPLNIESDKQIKELKSFMKRENIEDTLGLSKILNSLFKSLPKLLVEIEVESAKTILRDLRQTLKGDDK